VHQQTVVTVSLTLAVRRHPFCCAAMAARKVAVAVIAKLLPSSTGNLPRLCSSLHLRHTLSLSTPHAVECRPNRQSANLCVSSTPGYHANAPRHHHARRLARRAAPSQGRPLSAIGRPAVEHADVLTQSVPAARPARGRSLLAYRRTSTAQPVLFNLLWSEFAVVLIRHT
jgi:hypothetical protein